MHLQKAAAAQQEQIFEGLRKIGGADAMKEMRAALRSSGGATTDEVRAIQANPLSTYDQATLIEKGVQSWSWDFALTRENIENLDEETTSFLARAILELAKPALFRAPEDTGAEEKKV
jgi:S-adenosylhomocysteine hydrolase